MTKQPLLVMAAGGTGGHMFPAQALAEAMLARGWRVKLSTAHWTTLHLNTTKTPTLTHLSSLLH